MADGQANPQQPVATLPPDVASLTRAFTPVSFPPPVSPAQMDENTVMQQVNAIPDKEQQIIRGTGLGLSPMISKENDDAQLVPPSQVVAAKQSGYRPAILMRNTKGELHLVGNDEVSDAVNNDWTINKATPSPAPYVPKPQPPQMSEMMGLTSGPEAPAAAQLLNPAEIIRTLGNKYALPWLQRNAQQNLAEEQRELYKAVGPESATTSLPAQAAYTALAPLHRAAAMTSSIVGAGLTDRKAQAAIAAGMADPAIPLAYFATQGLQGATGLGTGQKGSLREAWENPTPENWSKALTDLAMTFGASEGLKEGVPVTPGGEPVPTPEGWTNRPVDTGYGASVGATGAAASKVAGPVLDRFRGLWDPEALSATKAATKAFRPRNVKAGWQDEIARSLPLMRRSADSMGIDVDNMTPDQALQATDDAARESWAEYKRNHLGPNADVTVNTQPVADAMRATIDNTMREQNPGLAAEIERIAGTFDNREMNLAEVQDRVSTLNNQTRNIEAKYPRDRAAAKIAPENEYQFVQRDTLRGLMDEQLNQLTGPGAAELRKNYGALRSVQDVIQRRLNVVDRGAREPLSAIMAKAYAAGHIATSILTGHPLGALGGILTAAAERRSRALQDPNYLTQLAFQKTQPAAPWSPTTPEGPRAPTTAEQVGTRAQQLAGAQQQPIPFPEGPLFGIEQTPPQRIGPPYEMPASSEPAPPAQGQLPPAAEQRQLPAGPPQGQLPAPRPEPVVPEMPPFRMRPSPLGPQRPALPPATLPERQISPTPGFEAPTAPSASAEQEALQRARAQGRGPQAEAAPEINQAIEDLFTGKQKSISQAHAKAISNMLLGAEAPPETMDWDVVRPGRGLPNAIRLNDTARKMVGASMGTGFGGASVSPATLDSEVLPRLEMAAMTMDKTRAQRPDYFSPDASAKVRDLIQTIQDNRGPEGVSFARSEGTPEEQRYTTHEELFHTAVQRRPAPQAGGLAVPDMADDPGMEKMRPRIIEETGRLTSIIHHAEGMADIMQGRAPELTPEEAGATAENYWSQLAAKGKLQALVDAFKLENFMDDHEQQNGYTVDDATNAIRTAGRDALARVLSREYGTDLRGLARAVQGEPGPADVAGTERGAVPAGAAPPSGGEANLGSPAETAAGAGRSPTAEVEPPEEASLFANRRDDQAAEDSLPAPEAVPSRPGDEHIVSTRKPTGKNPTFDHTTDTSKSIGVKEIVASGRAPEMVDAIRNYPGVKGLLKGVTDPQQALQKFVNFAADNIVAVYKAIDKPIRDMSRRWYPSANGYAQNLADTHTEHGITLPQAAAVIAVHSPNTEWNINASQASRVTDIWLNHQNTPYTERMAEVAPDITAASVQPYMRAIEGKSLGELTNPLEQAMWVRLYDEAENPTEYPLLRPDGTTADLARKKPTAKQAKQGLPGDPKKLAWSGLDHIAKGISILQDGSLANISEQLGDKHKVRNFYNNIVNPDGLHGHLTVDTHAVGAALFKPVSQDDVEVSHNFGGGQKASEPGELPVRKAIPSAGSNTNMGVSGTYGLYADAYRQAAQRVGELPQYLQSITWDGIRTLFPQTFKNIQGNKDIINNVWKDVDRGNKTPAEARREIINATAKIKGTTAKGAWGKPDWLGDTGLHEGEGTAPNPQAVAGSQLPRQRATPTVSGGRGGNPGGSPRQVAATPSPVPQIFKRVSRK